jgi:hypothetical protein
MTTIVTRTGKGSPLTWAEADANFTNLNTNKLEVTTAASTYLTQATATSTYLPITTATATYLPITTAAATYTTSTNPVTSGNWIHTGAVGYGGANYGTSGQVLQSNGSGTSPSWVTLSTTNSAVQGTFKNLVISTTGLSALITTTADEVIVGNGSGTYKTLYTVSLSINTTTSGANGLDTGSLVASTWYSVWIIYNPTTTTTAGLISTSSTSPTMPSGYTLKSRIGWIRTDGTANKYPLSYKQLGRRAQYVVATGSNVTGLPVMATGVVGSTTTPTWVAVGANLFVPPTASRIQVFIWQVAATGGIVIVAPSNVYGAYGSTTNPPILQATGGSGINMSVQGDILLESLTIYWASAGSASNFIACVGWEDNI